MDREEVLSVLSTDSADARPRESSLQQQAHSIISESPEDDTATLPSTLLALLSQIIKPLFTTTKHPNLTSTGRKLLVTPRPPSIANSFLNDPHGDNDSKPWKTPFTTPLLRYILKSYMLLPFDPPDDLSRKLAIAAHFHLLIPAILNMIDDPSPTPWKSSGCSLLILLCDVLVSCQSEIMRSSGMADVFVNALKTDFLLLPTLTEEDESLVVLGELYPAFLGVVDARFGKGTSLGRDQEFVLRQETLTLIYRHGIMASLEHLSASSDSFSNTSSVALTTFLLEQIPNVFRRMDVDSVKHFKMLLPMLRVGLMDPFALAGPGMVVAMLDVLDCALEVGGARVKEKWWPEILRGLVGCWLNCVDDRRGSESQSIEDNMRAGAVIARLKKTARLLGDVVESGEWKAVTKDLVEEEADLQGLFGT